MLLHCRGRAEIVWKNSMICINQNSYNFDETIKTQGLDAIVTFLWSLFYGEEIFLNDFIGAKMFKMFQNISKILNYSEEMEFSLSCSFCTTPGSFRCMFYWYRDRIFSFLFFCAQLLAVLGVWSIDIWLWIWASYYHLKLCCLQNVNTNWTREC